MSPENFELLKTIEIEASPELVYRFFTEQDLLERWQCREAQIDARPGGSYTFDITGQDITRGEFLELEPGKRILMTWGFDVPGSSTLEITLSPTEGGTLVSLRHFGFETEDGREGHDRGWTHYLGRLEIAARGDDPGRDTWLETRIAGEET